jgi:hypothetical protein
MTDTEQEIQQLRARREELRERLRAIHRDYGQGLDRDTEEQAQQLENAEVLEGLAKAAAEELETIEKRLAELGED